MKVLITGANGQLGYDLKRTADNKKFSLHAFSKQELDITNSAQVTEALNTVRPDIVINTAAYTKVDKAEAERELAFAINRDGARNLAVACEAIQSILLHFSTDYVFDGKKNQAYVETDIVSPLNVYGLSKWEGEEAIRAACKKHLIIRVSALFGIHGHNFVKTIYKLTREKDNLPIVSDHITCPTATHDIARMTWEICEQNNPAWGTYHFCGTPAVSWYEFAKQFADNLRPIASSDYPTAATRPAYSVLNCEKIKTVFKINQPHWKEGLHDVIHQLSPV